MAKRSQIAIPASKPRNPLVKLARFRQAGSHKSAMAANSRRKSEEKDLLTRIREAGW